MRSQGEAREPFHGPSEGQAPCRSRVALPLLALALAVGCAGAELEARTSTLREVTEKARAQGAYKCAPRELAAAEAYLAFAELEATEGDETRTVAELEQGERWGKAALELSPRGACGEAPPPVATEGDRDGDGLLDSVDKCPDDPEDFDKFEDEDGCPDPDNDQDGILDLADECPLEPEDKDGFEDANGCPDPDNDGDKVIDYPEMDDKCPNDYATTVDGCPQKYKLIVVTRDRIELKQTIYFDFRKATIRSVSYPLLEEVAKALRDNPTIQVRVEGHTDSRGGDAFNMKLSQARSESVRRFLIERDVNEGRLSARGFGETAAIADNRTQKGRDLNRRVEFVILKQ